jgi:uncharacterized Rmd1/YagE family protein
VFIVVIATVLAESSTIAHLEVLTANLLSDKLTIVERLREHRDLAQSACVGPIPSI